MADGFVESGTDVVMALKQTGITLEDQYAVAAMEDIIETAVKGMLAMSVTEERRLRRIYVMGLFSGIRIAGRQMQANLAAMKDAEKKPNIIETDN